MTRNSSIYSNPYYLRENYREYTPEAYKSQVVGIKKAKKKKTKRTPAQISAWSKKKQIAKEQAHMFCPMEVRSKGPHIGLYCAQHGTWIKWISQQDAESIKNIL
jgi:hypothetical protein